MKLHKNPYSEFLITLGKSHIKILADSFNLFPRKHIQNCYYFKSETTFSEELGMQ